MITENYLYDWGDDLPGSIRIQGQYSLSDLKNILSDAQHGIPSTGFSTYFENDQIVRGGLFNKQYTDCLLLKNSEHPTDYFHFVFTVHVTGNWTFINIYRSGTSKLNQQKYTQQQRKNSDSLFQNFLGAISRTDEAGLDAESDYYDILCNSIRANLGV